jgi:hypothetical protein
MCFESQFLERKIQGLKQLMELLLTAKNAVEGCEITVTYLVK